MTLQIGRLTGLLEPLQVQLTGNDVQLQGFCKPASAAAGQVLREQLLGYSDNPDEPVIPIISTVDSRLNGFYRVSQIDIPVTPVFERSGYFDYAMKAVQTSARQTAGYESILTGALMANDHGINAATAQPGHGFPTSAWEYYNPGGLSRLTRTSATGVLYYNLMGGSLYKGLARFSTLATDFYVGGCRVTDTTDNHVCVGTRESPTNWLIDNGLVQMGLANFTELFHTTFFDGVRWTVATGVNENAGDFSAWFVSSTGGGTMRFSGYLSGTNLGVKIIRNSPEEVIVRWPALWQNGLAWGPSYIDFRIRRGSYDVWCYLSSMTSDTYTVGEGLGYPGAIAGTALTGGIRATNNDTHYGTNGRVVLCSSKTMTKDLVNFRITQTGAKTFMDWGMSYERGGSGAPAGETAQEQIYQYLAAQSERLRVVAR